MSGRKSTSGRFPVSRREFLLAASAAAASWGAYQLPRYRENVPGSLVGANHKAGHILRTKFDRTPDIEIQAGTVIVGGGVSGLSAAWWLQRNGDEQFELLELDRKVGGNSQSGQNRVSTYPWGAHYVPVPGPDAAHVRELFEDLGVIEGYSADGLPIFNEYYICGAPKERLSVFGRWQTGMIPKIGIRSEEARQFDEFDEFIAVQSERLGADGLPAFTIPLDLSSRDPEILEWDKISMAEFLASRGWNAKPLLWYVNYCCRDDFGSELEGTSAWAGIHYFASRAGRAANAEDDAVLTWPEGNGWLVNQLKLKLKAHIRTQQLVFHIENTTSGAIVDSIDTQTMRITRRHAKAVIFSGPQFVAKHLIPELNPERAESFEYSPWVVANLTTSRLPHETGAPLCWDNVSYASDSLGYINSGHQKLDSAPKETVLTYYWPLTKKSPAEERKSLHKADYSFWQKKILDDFFHMHPQMRGKVKNLDLWFWGHGMIVPRPGMLWSGERQEAQKSVGQIHFAHSDLSGLSLFEEAQYQGVRAARACLDVSSSRGSRS
ncbi:MAG: NAD(P)-binding protein [Pseudomonadota bacterium]